ncbi:50S ribosomal protein L4 [Patescibacteria group bacterium]
MIKVDLLTKTGTKKGKIALPKVFDEKPNMDLLAQAIRVYEDRRHLGLSKVKTRSEVKLSTRKIYRQKGTGRARHGAKSAPIFVGGGKAHGPKGVKRTLNLPNKMKKKALGVSVSLKAKDNLVSVVEGISTFEKTKDANKLVSKFLSGKEKVNRVTVVLDDENGKSYKAFRNIEDVNVIRFSLLNAYSVYYGGHILFENTALKPKTSEKKNTKTAKKETKK